MDHSNVISNTVIVGSSAAYQELVDFLVSEAYKYPAIDLCVNDAALVGVRVDSFHDGTLWGATGTHLKNVTFSGFGSGSCEGSSVLHADSSDVRYFDTRNKL
jgi:hypothetical protein